jgi:hypothetical protein
MQFVEVKIKVPAILEEEITNEFRHVVRQAIKANILSGQKSAINTQVEEFNLANKLDKNLGKD